MPESTCTRKTAVQEHPGPWLLSRCSRWYSHPSRHISGESSLHEWFQHFSELIPSWWVCQLDIKLWKADPQVTKAELETQQSHVLCDINSDFTTTRPTKKRKEAIPTKISHTWAALGSSDHSTHLGKVVLLSISYRKMLFSIQRMISVQEQQISCMPWAAGLGLLCSLVQQSHIISSAGTYSSKPPGTRGTQGRKHT